MTLIFMGIKWVRPNRLLPKTVVVTDVPGPDDPGVGSVAAVIADGAEAVQQHYDARWKDYTQVQVIDGLVATIPYT